MAYINGKQIRMIADFAGGFDRLRAWEKTFTAEKTSNQELITADEWLKAHRNDEGLVLVIFTDSDLTAPADGNVFMYGFARNVEGAEGSGYQFIRNLTSAGGFANYFPQVPVGSDATPASRTLQISSNGTLKVGLSSSYKIAPTTYKIYAFIM